MMNFSRMLGVSNRVREKSGPTVISLIAFVVLLLSPDGWTDGAFCHRLSSAYVTLFSIFIGFSFSSMTMLIGISDTKYVQVMRKYGMFPLMMKYHWDCIRWCFIGVLAGISVTFIKTEDVQHWLGCVFVAVGIRALLSMNRLFRLFALVADRKSEQ